MRGLAIYPGSFDPITLGHLNVIERSSKVFDHIIVCIVSNPNKKPFFTAEERVEQVKKVCWGFNNVEVDSTDRLLADYCRSRRANIIIRGLRALSDFEHECQMATFNRKMNPSLDTFFLVADDKFTYLSSSAVREMAQYGADLSEFVPGKILGEIQEKFGNGGK